VSGILNKPINTLFI